MKNHKKRELRKVKQTEQLLNIALNLKIKLKLHQSSDKRLMQKICLSFYPLCLMLKQ